MPRKLRTNKRIDARMRVDELFTFAAYSDADLVTEYGSLALARKRYELLTDAGELRPPQSWADVRRGHEDGIPVVEYP